MVLVKALALETMGAWNARFKDLDLGGAILFFTTCSFVESETGNLDSMDPLGTLVLVLTVRAVVAADIFTGVLLVFKSLLVSFIRFIVAKTETAVKVTLGTPAVMEPPLPRF